jgi:phenylalanyl-tRNA synthetase beta chain
MKLSVNWLKEFVNIPTDARQLKSDLTMIGLNTESVVQVGEDWILDVEVTTNRPDCLSHYGAARELATLYRQPLKDFKVSVHESNRAAGEIVSIEIADPDLCSRYCGRVVEDVRVGPSPAWLAERLEALGQRPINNVADATNYVLMELGHPLHAFDMARLNQRKIIVRRAQPREPLRTLDGFERTLTRDNLVIADGTHPVALAGVMGGEESEIATTTRSVLLEAAWFDPVSIRRTSKSQGMHTEASHRFERGADVQMAPLAIDRTAALIQEIAGGETLRGIIDVYPRPWQPRHLQLARSEITRILGADVPGEEVERILGGLGFGIERIQAETWRVSVPSFRVDVAREVDLVEEVARHVGYDRLPARVRPAPPRVERDATRDKVIATSSSLMGLGYHEIIAPAMVDPAECERFSAAQPVVIANPLSQDASAMRTSAVPGMLRALRWNLDRDLNDLRLFEFGKVYSRSAEGVPQERRVLTLGATGHRRPASVYDSEAPLDFFDLKGDVQTILGAFALPALDFAQWESHPYLQPERAGQMRADNAALAVFGQIQQDLVRWYNFPVNVWVAEIDLEHLLEFPLRSRKFHPISKFPAVERDFSLVLADEVPYARLVSATSGLALEEMQGFRPVDRFRGGAIPPGHYSLLLRVTFQSATHTLTSDEVGALSKKLLTAWEGLGARLRTN